jgi:hypothetical protein
MFEHVVSPSSTPPPLCHFHTPFHRLLLISMQSIATLMGNRYGDHPVYRTGSITVGVYLNALPLSASDNDNSKVGHTI